jgi:hypothetical protein
MLGFARFLAASTACVALASGGSASAQTASSTTDEAKDSFPSPASRFRLEASGGAAFGYDSLPTKESVNAFGPNFGLRAGYTFPFGAAFALRYDHFFGSTSSYPVPLVALIEHRTSAHFLAADLGFEFTPSHAIFRPHLSIGLLGLRQSVTCAPVSGSFDSVAKDLCLQNDGAATSWAPAAAPGLLMGLGWSRYYGFVDVQYFFAEVDAFAIAGGLGFTL